MRVIRSDERGSKTLNTCDNILSAPIVAAMAIVLRINPKGYIS